MSTIKDQLLQMGLVPPAPADDGRRGERRERRGGRDREAERAPQREPKGPATPPTSTDDALIARIVDGGRIEGALGGRRRFYFESRDDRVLAIEVPDAIAGRLEKRELAICEAPDGAITIVDADTARRIAALDRTWLRN